MMDIEALYRKYGPMVLRRCRCILKDEEKALDAMQDSFVRLIRSGDRISADSPSSLLYRIATNVCLNMLRSDRTRRSEGDELLDSIAGPDDVEGLGIARQLIDGIFRMERPSTLTIAWLHYVDGMTLEETAAVAGLSVSGVRKRLAGLKLRHMPERGEAP